MSDSEIIRARIMVVPFSLMAANKNKRDLGDELGE
jgi:sirohydrochlorin ferrochelatase